MHISSSSLNLVKFNISHWPPQSPLRRYIISCLAGCLVRGPDAAATPSRHRRYTAATPPRHRRDTAATPA
eukprot:16429438-Heterocapsa_arctica.AAC.1